MGFEKLNYLEVAVKVAEVIKMALLWLIYFKFQECQTHAKKKMKHTYVNGKSFLSSHSYIHNRSHLPNQCIGHHCDMD